MTARRTLQVQGRQGVRVTLEIEVYRGKVWLVAVDPAFASEAVLEPGQADQLIDLLTQAVGEARGCAPEHTP